METLSLAIAFFVVVVLSLSFIIVIARSRLVSSGNVSIRINDSDDLTLQVPQGSKLLQTLADAKIFLSSACGGGGTCAQCRCIVTEGGGAITPCEEPYFSRVEVQKGWRLSCQVPVKQDMKIEVDPEFFGVKEWECEVVSNDNVATFIKELVLKLPEGEEVDFKAGGYVQLVAPPHVADYKNFAVQEEYHEDWDKYKIWENKSVVEDEIVRAYSMANYPGEKGILKFNIRVATPPPGTIHPPGQMSSHVFDLKKGDKMKVFGPYGEFFIKETQNEMIYIGGGAGMAPLRSHIFELLKRQNSERKISYWYGARSLRELFYDDEFKALEAKHSNFSWNVAMSDPLPEDKWTGYQGFIHNVVLENYLKNHPAPEDCEYYLCGPPMMIDAVKVMLDSLGVDKSNIAFDDFGS